jgi:hypothetical protein
MKDFVLEPGGEHESRKVKDGIKKLRHRYQVVASCFTELPGPFILIP